MHTHLRLYASLKLTASGYSDGLSGTWERSQPYSTKPVRRIDHQIPLNTDKNAESLSTYNLVRGGANSSISNHVLTSCSEVDDMEQNWCYSQPFDFIHCRYLAGSIADWPRLMAQAFKYTKPGGWVEFQDFDMRFYSTDGTFVPGSAPDIWASEIIEALKTFGREPEPGPKLEQWVRDAGFENLHHELLPIPVGMWLKDRRLVSDDLTSPNLSPTANVLQKKEIGACDLSMFLEGLEGISLRALTNARGWGTEEVLAFLSSVRNDLCNRRIHALHNL